ncbi:MAG: ABC transporter ATP-binding protein [Clostridia bacterium]|nr:ABC transporter ATP-binding protein [Clostridia bacterium]
MITFKNVSSGYGKKQILSEISLSFSKGKVTAIVGPNGSGKSTLLKTAVSFLNVFCGEIYVGEKPLLSLSRKEIAKRIAYLPQSKTTPDMTVGQMILHGRFPHISYPRDYSEKDRKIADEAAKKVGLSVPSDTRLEALSGGMRQLCYIAMALAQDTEYILLDEPTTYLDISHQISLMKLLKDLADDRKGIVTVMHDLPFAFTFADEIVVMCDGKVALCGKPEEIHKNHLIKDVFGVELRYNENEKVYEYKY